VTPARAEAARILVVDDEPKLVAAVCRALSSKGFSVDSAPDGARGLELIEEHEYELVVLDLLMDGVDGITVLKETTRTRPWLPVVVLSALDDVKTRVRCFELGAADYITKPFSIAELRARIEARLRAHSNGEIPNPKNNGLKLDPARRIVDVGHDRARLTQREFRLLAHLVRHQGRVCSRAELLEDVWGCTFDPGTNVVDVYVGRLRAKLGSAVIETVRSVGYCVPVSPPASAERWVQPAGGAHRGRGRAA
jgi:DNA-binding response OmpR family regulator